jgi:hypothetical protein
MLDTAYAPSDMEKMRNPRMTDEDLFRNPRLNAVTDMNSYVAYFIDAARAGESAEIRAAALNHLDDFKTLSPAFGDLVYLGWQQAAMAVRRAAIPGLMPL